MEKKWPYLALVVALIGVVCALVALPGDAHDSWLAIWGDDEASTSSGDGYSGAEPEAQGQGQPTVDEAPTDLVNEPEPEPAPVAATPAGYLDDGGYYSYDVNHKNPADTNYYYWHYLLICVSDLNAGNYTLVLSNDTQNSYATFSLQLPSSGCVNTGQLGGTLTSSGSAGDWYSIEVSGQFTTQRYQPWT